MPSTVPTVPQLLLLFALAILPIVASTVAQVMLLWRRGSLSPWLIVVIIGSVLCLPLYVLAQRTIAPTGQDIDGWEQAAMLLVGYSPFILAVAIALGGFQWKRLLEQRGICLWVISLAIIALDLIQLGLIGLITVVEMGK